MNAVPTTASDRRPRVLVVASPGTEASVIAVFEHLLDLGAGLTFAYGRRGGRVPESLLERPGVSVERLPLERTGQDAKTLRTFRHGANTLRFLDPALGDAAVDARFVTARALSKRIKNPRPDVLLDAELPERVFRNLMTTARNLERLIPPHAELEEGIASLAPGAILLISRCGLNSVEADVLKVARRLGLPSAMLVHSWDNLTSKAVLHEHPDRLLVWNETMAWEASEYHRVPAERVDVVGAALFDDFFAVAQATPDVPPAEPAIAYVGSSPYVCDDEAGLCRDWVAAVRGSGDPVLAGARIDVRPHPADKSWTDWQPPDDRVVVHGSKKLDGGRLLALLRGATAVVGLNTSAELEAAIADRPVITLRAGVDRAPGQEGTLHFPYMLEATGGFVVDAHDLPEHVAALARAVRGEIDPAPRRRFVEHFLRPRGVNRPVAPIAAEAIAEAFTAVAVS